MIANQNKVSIGIAFISSSVLAIAGFVVGPHPIVGLIAALAPLALMAVLPRPFLLALLFLLFSFFRLHEVFPQLMPLRLPLLLALGTIASLAWGLAFRRIEPFWDPLFTPFVIFFILTTLGIVTASNPMNSFGYWKDTYVKIAIMVFALSWSIRSEKDMRWILRAIVLCGIAVAIITLRNKAQGIGLVEGSRVTIGRDLGSMLGDPNDLSLVLLFAVGSSLGACTTKGVKLFDRALGLMAYVLLVLAVVATQSRGGLLGVAAVTGVFAAQKIRSKLLLGTIGIAALVALYAVAGISDRQSGGAHEEGIDESAMGRIHAWVAAMRMAVHNPFTGVGVDNFLFNYFDYSDFWDGQNHAVHSTWFGVLGETGLLGFIIFTWMMIGMFKTILSTKRTLWRDDETPPILKAASAGLLGGFVGFCVSGSFLTQGFTWPIYIILAVTIGLSRITAARQPCLSAHAKQMNGS